MRERRRETERDGERGGEKRTRRYEERDRRERGRREQSSERCLCSQDPKIKLGINFEHDEDEEYMDWDDEDEVRQCLSIEEMTCRENRQG